jgi:hypothetical protein
MLTPSHVMWSSQNSLYFIDSNIKPKVFPKSDLDMFDSIEIHSNVSKGSKKSSKAKLIPKQ